MRTIILLLVVTILAGCASYPDVNRTRLESLPQHYFQSGVKMAWEVKLVGDEAFVDGMVQNIRCSYMEGAEVWVRVLSASGNPGRSSVSYIIPYQFNLHEIAPFSVKLPTRVESGTRLLFTFRYEGCNDSGGWMQSFESVVP